MLLISSELDEVLGMSDRVLVMRQGRICGEFPAAGTSETQLLHAALGSRVVIGRPAPPLGPATRHARRAARARRRSSRSRRRYFLTHVEPLNVLEQTAINTIIAVGMTFVIVSGGIDLSVGSLLALAGVVLGSVAAGRHARSALALLLPVLCGTARSAC